MPSSVCTVCASHAALVLVLMSILPAPSEQSNAVLDAIQHHLPSHCDDKHDGAGEGHARITPGSPIRGMVHHKWWSDCIMATIAGSDSMQWPLYQHINALLNEDHIKGTSGKQQRETQAHIVRPTQYTSSSSPLCCHTPHVNMHPNNESQCSHI